MHINNLNRIGQKVSQPSAQPTLSQVKRVGSQVPKQPTKQGEKKPTTKRRSAAVPPALPLFALRKRIQEEPRKKTQIRKKPNDSEPLPAEQEER